jgi:hypothetical protein
LSDELIGPLLVDGTVASSINIHAVVFAGRCAVDCYETASVRQMAAPATG